jgi:hypothetical protein
VRIGYTPPQKMHQGRADVIKQRLARPGVTLLQLFHQVGALTAALNALCIIQLIHSIGSAKSYARDAVFRRHKRGCAVTQAIQAHRDCRANRR